MTNKGKGSLLILFLVIFLLLAYLVMHLKIVSDIGQFMPTANKDPQLQALMSEIQNGPAATTLMIRLYKAKSLELSALSRQLRQTLHANDEVFSDIKNGEGVMDWHAAESLFPYRYLLSGNLKWESIDLRKVFENRLSELRAGSGAVISDILTIDPQLAFIKYLHNVVDFSGPIKQHGVWFDKTGQSALLLVSVNSTTMDLDLMQRAVDEIQTVFEKKSTTSTAQLEIAGPGKMAVETRVAIEHIMRNMTQVIVIMLIAIFLFAYRSFHSIWLASLPLISAIVVSLVVTQMIFGSVHSIVLVFGVALLGVCLDYPLHLFSHLRKGEVALSSLKRIWPTMRLSGISTILAYLALLGSGFEGLSQLAVFAVSGLIIALVITRYLLPILISPDQIKPRLSAMKIDAGFKQRLFMGIVLLGSPVLLIMQTGFNWETSIHALSPVPASARERDQVLRSELNIAEVSHVFLQGSQNIEAALRASEKIYQKLSAAKEQGIIKSIWSPSQVLPSKQSQHQRQLSLPSELQLTSDLKKALKGLPFKLTAFSPWIKSVSSSAHIEPLSYEDIIATPLAPIIQQGLFKHSDQWLVVVRIGGISSESDLNAWLNAYPELKKTHIVVKHATEHLLNEYRIVTFERLLAVIVLLFIIVLVWSRSIVNTIWIFLPVSIGVLSGVAITLFLGSAINVFHLLALLLVLGMGLDYSLFFNKARKDNLEYQQSLHAISISALSTSVAFSVLAFSSVPVLAGMGKIVSIGILMCFVASWILIRPQTMRLDEGKI